MIKKLISFMIAIALIVLTVTVFTGCANNNSTTTVTEQAETIASGDSKLTGLDNFSTTDINGEVITQDVFKGKKLTLVNVLSVTCDPCMEELPYLSELAEEYKDKNMGFLGVSIDMDNEGNPDESTKEDFKKLIGDNAENINVAYLDINLMTKIFSETDAIPYTFFVDENGKIVGGRYTGSHSKEEWRTIIEKELENAAA